MKTVSVSQRIAVPAKSDDERAWSAVREGIEGIYRAEIDGLHALAGRP